VGSYANRAAKICGSTGETSDKEANRRPQSTQPILANMSTEDRELSRTTDLNKPIRPSLKS